MEGKISQVTTQQVDFEAPVGVEDNLIKVNARRGELLDSPPKRRKWKYDMCNIFFNKF